MTTDVQTSNNKLDILKWVFVVALIVLAIIGNQYFADKSALLRAGVVIVMVIIAGVLAFTTVKGRTAFEFAKEAHIEVRKVVWPTRQETLQTTLIVSVFVVIMALLMWFVDWSLVHLLGYIVG